MVEVVVEDTNSLAAKLVLSGDAGRLEEIDDGLLGEGPHLLFICAGRLSGNLWHVNYETGVRRAGVAG